jgi:8-oxo-dGTP pyrophosphatase MutT (NUDIX family)
MQYTENNWQTLSSKVHYDNPWIMVSEHQVINPSGKAGIYGKVHFKNLAVGIVPIDEKGNIHLVGQFRYTLGRYSIEIPEGGSLETQSPLDSAKRELEEETGINAGSWEHIITMHLSNSVTDEKAMVYLATDLKFGKPKPEDTEKIDQICIPLDKAFQMVLNHEITDSMSVSGILFAKMRSLQKAENEKK